jgi:hypothetical protein
MIHYALTELQLNRVNNEFEEGFFLSEANAASLVKLTETG